MSAVKSEIMENATNVEIVGSWPFGQDFLCRAYKPVPSALAREV